MFKKIKSKKNKKDTTVAIEESVIATFDEIVDMVEQIEEPDVVGGVAQFVAPTKKQVKVAVQKELLLTSGINSGSKFVNKVLQVNGKVARFETQAAAVSAKKRYGGKVIEKNLAFEVHN